MTALDDGTLYDRWLEARDGDAFAELARRHSPVVHDITSRVLGDRAGAEDVLQEALLSLALERTRKPVEVGVVAWLARFAICRARNRRASERSRARRQIVVGLERPEESMPDDRLERSEELEFALTGCDPEDRALLAMRFLHGWEYDRIASALSIREGAARVRVHRALESVRGRLNASPGTKLGPALAALPVGALTSSRLDAIVQSAVEIAKVRLGAPPNGVEQATAAERSFRVAVTLAGTALLFVSAAGATVAHELAAAAEPEVAIVDVRGGAAESRIFELAALPSGAADRREGARVFPRPYDWDLGVLRARDAVISADLPAGSAAAARTSGNARAAEPVPGVGRGLDAAAPDAANPVEEPPNASRPLVRGACAAKGDSVSSEGERAGAFGGSSGTAGEAARDDGEETTRPGVRQVVRNGSWGGATGRGAASSTPAVATVSIESLPEETRDLVRQAEDLVRRMLDDDAAVAAAAVDDGVRKVRRRFTRLRRDLAAADSGAPAGRGAAKAARRQSAAIRQMLSYLTEVVLSDGRAAGALRWPAGANVTAALEEVIRVLGVQGSPATDGLPAGGTDLPSGATASGGVE